MATFGDLRTHCKENDVKFTTTRNKDSFSDRVVKITITKTRAIKIVLTPGKMGWSLWDPQRQNYVHASEIHTGIYNFEEKYDIVSNQYGNDKAIDLLNTAKTHKKSTPGDFPVPKQEFDPSSIIRYTNGLVKMDISITQAYVTGVVKITNRGAIKEVKVDDNCDCWFLVDGRGKCKSECGGRPVSILYDGEQYFVSIEKKEKSCRVSKDPRPLTLMDKMVVDAALKLFLTLKEESG